MQLDKNTNIAITAEFLCHSHFTGIENYLYHLVHSIAALDRVSLTLICPSNIPYSLIPGKTNIYKHDTLKMPGTNLISSLINPPKGMNQFDLIHCPTVVAPFFLKNRGVKVVMTVHDLIPILFPEYHTLKRTIYFKYILKYRFNFVDHFIVPSNSVKKDLIRLFNIRSNKVTVINEGVSDLFVPKYGKKEDYILAVSTLEPRKNFKSVINCFIELKKSNKLKEKLVIVGKDGWLCKDIYNIPDEFQQEIIFKGYVSETDLIKHYQRAKLFIYPSFYEGFGLPVIEAMACGCPVITSNSSSLPEITGDAALTVNPNREDAIKEAILKLINDETLAEIMKIKGLNQSRKFTWRKCAEDTIKTYEKVLTN